MLSAALQENGMPCKEDDEKRTVWMKGCLSQVCCATLIFSLPAAMIQGSPFHCTLWLPQDYFLLLKGQRTI